MYRKKCFYGSVALLFLIGANGGHASGTFNLSGSNPPIIVHADFTDPATAGDLPAAYSNKPDLHEPPAPAASYWKLNNSASNDVAGAPTLQLMGGLSFNPSATGLGLGKHHDGAILLDGTSHYLNATGTASQLAFGFGDFSVGIWYASSAKVYGKQVLVSKGNLDGGEPGFELFIERTAVGENQMGARVSVASSAGGTPTATASCLFPKNLNRETWNHLLLVVDRHGPDPSIRIYFNGDLVANSNRTEAVSVFELTGAYALPPGDTVDNSSDLILGAATGPSGIQNHFKGYLDDVKLFNTALTNKEAKLASQTPQSLYTADYACHWLQDFIERMTGTKPEIYSEVHPYVTVYGGPVISVGHTALAANQGILPTAGQSRVEVVGSGVSAKAFVVGHDAFGPREDDPDWNPLDPANAVTDGWFIGNKGTCKAATMLLEQFGVKWFIPGTKGVEVPMQNPVAIFTATDQTYATVYDYILGSTRVLGPGDSFTYATGLYSRRKVKSYWSHTWPRWVPPDLYASNSALFYDSFPNDPVSHLCTSSGDAKQMIVDAIKSHFDAGFDFVELGQTDGWKSCECSLCTAAFDTPRQVNLTINGTPHTVSVKDFDEVLDDGTVVPYTGVRWPSGVIASDPLDPDGKYGRFERNPCRRIHVFHRDIVNSIPSSYFSEPNSRKIMLSGYQIAWAPPRDDESYPADRILVQHTKRPYSDGITLWQGKSSGAGVFGYYWGNWKSSGSLPKSSPAMLLESFQSMMASAGPSGAKGMQYSGKDDDWALEGPVYYVAHSLAQESDPASWDQVTLDQKVREYCDFAYGNSSVGALMADFFDKLYACINASHAEAILPENKSAEWFFSNTFTPADITAMDADIDAAFAATAEPTSNMMHATKLNYDLLRAYVLMFHAKHDYEEALATYPLASQLMPKLDAWEAAVNEYHAARSALLSLTNTSNPQYADYRREWYSGAGLAYNYLTNPHPNAAYTPPTSTEFSDARESIGHLTAISYWKFDGTLDDALGLNPLDFGSFDTDDIYLFDDSAGWAKHFDGVDDYLATDAPPGGMNFGFDDFSVSCRVRFPDANVPNPQTILMIGDVLNSVKLYRAKNNTPRVTITVDGTTYTCNTSSSSTFASGVFQHLCFTLDRSGAVPVFSLYLDGVKVNTGGSAMPMPDNSSPVSPAQSPIFVGAGKNSSGNAKDFLYGQVDALRIDEIALTAQEVEDLASANIVPLSRWALDHNSDDEFGGNPGTLSPNATYGSDELGGGAVALNGIDAKVTIAPADPQNSSLEHLADGNFSVSMRIRPDALSSSYQHLFTMGGSSHSFDIRIASSSPGTAKLRVRAYLNGATTQMITQDTPFTLGDWTNLCVVVIRDGTSTNSGSVTLHWEGISLTKPIAGNLSGSTRVPFDTQPLTIGAAHTHYFFDGTVDDVRIYPGALTDEEVSSIPFPGF